MQSDNILGSSAAITGQQSAMDILQARLQAAEAQNPGLAQSAPLYNAESAIVPYNGPAPSTYSSYNPAYGPVPEPPPLPPETGLVPYSTAYRGGYGGYEYAGRGFQEAPVSESYAYDRASAIASAVPNFRSYADDLGSGVGGGGGYSYNERWRTYRRDSTRRMADDDSNEEPIEASYAGRNFIDVEGKAYDANLKGRFQEYGDKFKSQFGETFGSTDMQFAIGFGFMQTASGISRALAPQLSGESTIAGQEQQQAATSLFPLVGSVIGTAVGSRFGQGLAGQFVGGAAGGIVESAVDEYQGGHNFAQQRAGESLGYGRGGEDAVKEFADALRSAATPAAKELADTLTSLGKTGPVAPSAAGEFGQFQFALGTSFQQNTNAVGGFLSSSPFFASQRETFGSHPMTGLSSTDYFGIAQAAAASGNYEAMQGALSYAGASETIPSENPAYRRDRQLVQASEGRPAWERFMNGDSSEAIVARIRLRDEPQFLPGTVPPNVAAQQKQIEQQYESFQRNQADITGAAAALGADSSGLQLAMLRGGGASAVRAALPGVRSDVTGGLSAVDADISALRAAEASNPTNRPFYEAQINQDRQRAEQLRMVPAQAERMAFTAGLQEEESGYDLTTLRARLEGRAPSVIADEQRRQARYLEGVQGPISPSERNALTGQAVQLRYNAAQEQYGQEEGQVNLGVSRAAAGVQIAAGGGTPSQVYQAQIEYAKELADLQRQYNSEVERGNLTWEQANEKRREAVRLGGEINNAQDQARVSYFASVGAMDDANTGAARAGLGRAVEIQGNSAYGAMTGVTVSGIADARRAVDAAPAGTVEQRRALERLSVLQAQGADNETDRQTYSPDIASATRLSRDKSAFRVAMDAPYMDGPDSNPMTRGNALLGDLQSQRAQAQAELRTSTDPIAIRRNTDIVGQFDEQIAGLERERMTGMFRALPEMVAGGIDSGYGVYAQTPYAMAAALGGANPTTGSIGRPNFGVTVPQTNTTAMGAFMGAAGLGGGDSTSLLREIAAALHRIADRGGSGLGVQAPPMGDNFGTLRNDQRRTFDTSRPYDHLSR